MLNECVMKLSILIGDGTKGTKTGIIKNIILIAFSLLL